MDKKEKINIQQSVGAIIEQLPYACIVFNSELEIIVKNTTFKKIVKYTLSKENVVAIPQLFDKATLEICKSVLKGFQAEKEGGVFQYPYGANKRIFKIKGKPFNYLNKPEVTLGLISLEDITEDYTALKAVNASYDIFQTVTDNVSMPIYAVDYRTQEVLFMNQSAKKVFGDHVGETCYKALFENQNEICPFCPMKMIEYGLDLYDTEEGEFYYTGNDRYYQFSADIISGGTENYEHGMVMSLTDITDLKMAEELITKKNDELQSQTDELEVALLQLSEQNLKINIQTDKLERLSATKEKMFSIIGHDLRGPAGNIKTALDIIINEFDELSREEILDFLVPVRDLASSVYNLLYNLLHWAKNQSGGIKMDPQVISLNSLVEEGLSLYQSELDRKKLSCKFTNSQPVEVLADEQMITTVIRNLLSNAVKFSPVGKTIDIRLDVKEAKVRCTVKDNGVGISKDNITKILSSDSHFTTYGTEQEKGSGLGLSITKDFLKQHDSRLNVKSTINRGTEFWFTLYIHGNKTLHNE
ncbi:MAG: PAS domain-containing sensor histidine kinase [Bacteroidota bacterium]|nr:PAS domain-containing sensor histidine kinase [Bacteroidota bacterium]